jgi:putative transcriptional regulator
MAEATVPSFVRESFSEEEGADAAELDRAGALVRDCAASGLLVEPRAPSDAALLQLARRVAGFPDRYAPFFDQLAAMFDVEESTLRQSLASAGDVKNWKPSGLPGVRLFTMTAGPRAEGAEATLVRFAPGMSFPKHRHHGEEVTLILEGGYVDERGTEYHPGDLDARNAADAVHAFRTFPGEPCVAASVNRGFEFIAWPMRLLAKLAGR